MIVVSDTSPICYLVLIGQVGLLPELFGRVFVPPSVLTELAAAEGPEEVRAWATRAPDWIGVRETRLRIEWTEKHLHIGEKDALALAKALSANLVILDDLAARRQAKSLGLAVTGLLGILDRAAKRQWVDRPEIVRRLQRTSFRASPSLLRAFLLDQLR